MSLVCLAGAVGIALMVAARTGLFAAHDRDALLIFITRVRTSQHSMLLFVSCYALAASVGVPVTPLTLAGGVIFGPSLGILLNWISDMLAASLAFAGARLLLARKGHVTPPAAEARGFMPLLRLRVIPVVPFSALNVGSAFYDLKWPVFLGATALGVLPSTIVYTFSAGQLVSGVVGAGRRPMIIAIASGVVIICLSLVPYFLKRSHPSHTGSIE